MRAVPLVLLWPLVACGGDDGDGGGGASFEAVRGVEGQDVYNLTTTPDALFFARTVPNGRPMHAVGDQVPWILGFTRGPSGDLFVSASVDNLASSDAYLYVLRGQTWQQLGQMPGRGDLAFGGDGTFYAAITVVGGPGGLWSVRW